MVDPGARERNLKRLKRIEGQVRGLHKMVEEDKYCEVPNPRWKKCLTIQAPT